MSTPSWITTFLCPGLGCCIANLVGLAPVRAVLKARKMGQLGPLSPIPFALNVNNCLGWVTYGLFKGDYFLFFSCSFPLIVSFALCLSAIHILEKTSMKSPKDNIVRNKIEIILLATCCFWITLIFITGLVLKDPIYNDITLTTVGSACASCNILFYAAPLLHIMEVIQTKDSSSLYYPALILNGASSILWVFYGLLGVNDVAIYLPSLVGLFLVIIGLGMCCIYPAMYKDEAYLTETEDNTRLISPPPYALFHNSRQMSLLSLNTSGKVYMDHSIERSTKNSNLILNEKIRKLSMNRNSMNRNSFYRDKSNFNLMKNKISDSGKGRNSLSRKLSDSDLYTTPHFFNKLRLSSVNILDELNNSLDERDDTIISIDTRIPSKDNLDKRLLKTRSESLDV